MGREVHEGLVECVLAVDVAGGVEGTMAWYSRPGTCWVLPASTSTIGTFGALSSDGSALAYGPCVQIRAIRVGAREARSTGGDVTKWSRCSESAGRFECPWSSESERGAWAVLTRRGRDIMVKGQAVVWPSESRQSAGLEPDGGT